MAKMTESRLARLQSFLRGLDDEERAWLARTLRAGLSGDSVSRGAMRRDLLTAELWLNSRMANAKNSAARLSRGRLWMIFMLLRYGGLRPAEIASLTPSDFALEEGMIRIRGRWAREAPLPLDAAARMRRKLCELPEEPGFLGCDPAQLRRSLRGCARVCKLPPGSLSPSVLRKNRAAELEAAGLPYALINLFMGRASSGPLAACGFDDPQAVLKTCIQEEAVMKTSARNVFQGKVAGMRRHGILAEITIETASGLKVISMITETSREKLALSEGKVVNALVKAPFVSVVPATERAAAAASADNRFAGKVEEIHRDDVAEEIIVALPEGVTICALYAHGARPSDGVAKGADVEVCFSSFAVILTEE